MAIPLNWVAVQYCRKFDGLICSISTGSLNRDSILVNKVFRINFFTSTEIHRIGTRYCKISLVWHYVSIKVWTVSLLSWFDSMRERDSTKGWTRQVKVKKNPVHSPVRSIDRFRISNACDFNRGIRSSPRFFILFFFFFSDTQKTTLKMRWERKKGLLGAAFRCVRHRRRVIKAEEKMLMTPLLNGVAPIFTRTTTTTVFVCIFVHGWWLNYPLHCLCITFYIRLVVNSGGKRDFFYCIDM